MDVLSPELLWVRGRCYRLQTAGTLNFETSQCFESYDLESKYEAYLSDDCDNEFCQLEETVEVLPNNRYKLCLQVPQAFWSKIIGTKGITKKRIENDTKTTIIIPKLMEQGDIIIKGSSKKCVILAKKNIDAIVESSRQKLSFTHFVSIPMSNNEIKTNFLSFKEQVLNLFGSDRGVDDSIFQVPEKLHITICTLVLTDQSERNTAENILNEVCEQSLKPLFNMNKLCTLEMKGIEYMNDDPAEVDVLYAKVYSKNEKELLQKFANIIFKTFHDYKLIKSDSAENVKLHVTLMNTLFREEEIYELSEENTSKVKYPKKTRKTFNAVNILQAFQDYYFGEEELKNIQLSVRFSSGKDGFYKSTCIVNL